MSSTLKVDILQDSGGNNIIASDGSGNLTTQNILHPAFHVSKNSEQTGISSATYTTVQFDNETFDTDSAYDTSTYKFTVPTGKAGKYYFYASTRVLAAAGNAKLNKAFLKIVRTRDSTETEVSSFGIDLTNNPIFHISAKTFCILDCEVGDEYKVQARGDVGSSTVTLANTNSLSYFGAYRIGD